LKRKRIQKKQNGGKQQNKHETARTKRKHFSEMRLQGKLKIDLQDEETRKKGRPTRI
jgi:hypothetical protein